MAVAMKHIKETKDGMQHNIMQKTEYNEFELYHLIPLNQTSIPDLKDVVSNSALTIFLRASMI